MTTLEMTPKQVWDRLQRHIDEATKTPGVIDRCKCSDCNTTFDVADLPKRMESEGWEYPSYEVQDCPRCKDGGCIDDYWSSSWENLDEDTQEGTLSNDEDL